ncbi:MAG: Lipid II:glycine glycyltransferase [Microgenomates group bacterium ADurb.Bin219]|nr:MAG: Lipid II:glycine glycyltransferase [Microgenomates group bacterium ADurb.Bin219]
MIIKELTAKDKEAFNKLVNHPLQSYEWGEFREKLGQKVVRAGIYEKEKLVSAFQLFFHKIPHLPYTVGYFPKGPLPTKEIIKFLKEIGQENKAIFIKLEPNTVNGKQSTVNRKTMIDWGLFPGKPIFTKYTSVIDLSLSEEELLKKMHPKTRYNIRLAEKRGVTAKEDNSPKAFKEYLKLLFETTARQGFYAHSQNFHQAQWQILQPAGISRLLTAGSKDDILAAFLLFVFKDTLYYPYGASTREHKELMAPTLLMWEAIKFGKKLGLKKFDLWGDLEPNPSPNHPYYGFHRFKEGFSPKLVEFVGTYDLVINPKLYKLYNLIDKLRWKILRLKAKTS